MVRALYILTCHPLSLPLATNTCAGLNSLRKLQSVDCLTAAEERDSEDAADLDLESGESGLEWALARQITNAA